MVPAAGAAWPTVAARPRPGGSPSAAAPRGSPPGRLPLFRSIQTTGNPLEPSAGAALKEASEAGCAVIVKEALANGRLAGRSPGAVTDVLAGVAAGHGVGCDAVALAAALHQPWATVVLSGAATVAQLDSNLVAASVSLTEGELAQLARLAEEPEQYWQQRSSLPWT